MPEQPDPPSETVKDLLDQGVLVLNEKQETDALLLFERATQLDVTNAIAWTGVGAAAYKLHQYNDALAAFERAVACDPAMAAGWNRLYAALWQVGRTDEALEAIARATTLDPTLATAFLQLVPPRPETIDDLLSLRRYAKDLSADDILRYEPGVPVDIYGMAIGIRPGVSNVQKRRWGMRLILGAQSVLVDLGARGIVIRSIQAHSYKPDGIRMMRHMGFMETEAKAEGLRDFIIPVEQSGITIIVEYKEGLQQWRQRHRQADSGTDGKVDAGKPGAGKRRVDQQE
jgi:tetratricopeptide (TPR) repeat protein